jgi:hypothetical protein
MVAFIALFLRIFREYSGAVHPARIPAGWPATFGDKMILRDYVQFEAAFPPGPIKEEEGIVAPIGGEAIMKIFAERLTAQGFGVRSP